MMSIWLASPVRMNIAFSYSMLYFPSEAPPLPSFNPLACSVPRCSTPAKLFGSPADQMMPLVLPVTQCQPPPGSVPELLCSKPIHPPTPPSATAVARPASLSKAAKCPPFAAAPSLAACQLPATLTTSNRLEPLIADDVAATVRDKVNVLAAIDKVPAPTLSITLKSIASVVVPVLRFGACHSNRPAIMSAAVTVVTPLTATPFRNKLPPELIRSALMESPFASAKPKSDMRSL